MRHPLLIKILTLCGIMIVLFLALGSVSGLISERQAYQKSVVNQIANAGNSRQTVLGPVLVIPFTRHSETVKDDVVTRQEEEGTSYVFPRRLVVNGKLAVSPRRIGIYTTQIYTAALHMTGEFTPPSLEELRRSEEAQGKNISVVQGSPYLAVFISDVRGIRKVPVILWGEETLDVLPGSALYPTRDSTLPGLHAPISLPRPDGRDTMPFSFDLDLQGAQALNIVPIGRNSGMTLTADWPHPSFAHTDVNAEPILPVKRSISDAGFSADWESSWFANNVNDRFLRPVGNPQKFLTSLPSFSVSLIQTVDQYQLNQRSIKYAALFIVLTFTSVFLFEIMRGLQVHAVQYALVGAGLVVFYLLLLALSEHVGFNTAYLLAAAACVGQIGYYVTFVLGGRQRGVGFTLLLVALYAVLFGLLQSEDNALLLGSLLLFAILTGIMIITRRFNWYNVGHPVSSGFANTAAPPSEALSKNIADDALSKLPSPEVSRPGVCNVRHPKSPGGRRSGRPLRVHRLKP